VKASPPRKADGIPPPLVQAQPPQAGAGAHGVLLLYPLYIPPRRENRQNIKRFLVQIFFPCPP
jgi:hypothetical protein